MTDQEIAEFDRCKEVLGWDQKWVIANRTAIPATIGQVAHMEGLGFLLYVERYGLTSRQFIYPSREAAEEAMRRA